MVTDRPCGAEAIARELGLQHRRIPFDSRQQFSRDAAHWLHNEQGMDWSCLLFLRLVSHELFDRAPCFNLHPSLLPSFSGFGAIEKTLASGVKFFGATVHRVDDSVDGGPICGQIVSPIPANADRATMQRLSFAHKLYLLLALAERLGGGGLPNLA
jgi:phosphoribosylglycinamide formyltransferase 1